MYSNLILAMDEKRITFTQISELLKCQLRTVSDKCKGAIKTEFSVSEALLIKRVFFPEYDFNWLFKKDEATKQTDVR